MIMKKSLVVMTLLIMGLSGCSAIQEDYKPLYQVKPDTEKIKGGTQ